MPDRDQLSRLYRDEILPRLRVEDVYADVRLVGRGKQLRAPCPLHGGKNLSFVINVDTLEWWCHSRCSEGGDAANYVMRAESMSFREAVLELARRAGVDVGSGSPRPGRAARARRQPSAQRTRSAPKAEPPCYPPRDEVHALWADASPVTDSPDVAAWLTSKRIDAIMVADLDVVRVLPRTGPLPSWARYGRTSWRDDGYLLLARMFDARGQLRSIAARNILPDEKRRQVYGEPIQKSTVPKGEPSFGVAGLVLTCPIARHVLAAATLPDGWPPSVPLRVWIVEGEKKLCMRASLFSDAAECVPAVLGVKQGCWTAEIAARIPNGSTVVLLTDQNPPGARYASAIVRTLAARARAGLVRIELRDEFAFGRDDRGEVDVRLTAAALARYEAERRARRAT